MTDRSGDDKLLGFRTSDTAIKTSDGEVILKDDPKRGRAMTEAELVEKVARELEPEAFILRDKEMMDIARSEARRIIPIIEANLLRDILRFAEDLCDDAGGDVSLRRLVDYARERGLEIGE